MRITRDKLPCLACRRLMRCLRDGQLVGAARCGRCDRMAEPLDRGRLIGVAIWVIVVVVACLVVG